MCEARRVLALIAMTFGAVAGLTAQSAPTAGTDREALRARIEQLVPLVQEANVRAAAADVRLRTAPVPSETIAQRTIYVGPLMIVARSEQADEARALFEEAWADYAPLFGSSSEYLAYAVFTYHRGAGEPPAAPNFRNQAFEFDFLTTRRAREESIRSALATGLSNALPAEVTAWVESAPIPIATDGNRARVYRDLTLAPSPTARACLTGSESECWSGMGAPAEGVDPLAAWYSPYDQRMRVQRAVSVGSQSESLRGLCMSGSEPACSEWLTTFLPWSAIPPVPRSARASLVEFALRRGGTGALERMNDEFGSFQSRSAKAMGRWGRPIGPNVREAAVDSGRRLRGALEAASGTDAATLMREWQASIRGYSRAADPVRPSGSSRTVTIAWMLLFAGLATRSTRWRLG
jgi:hypothetical protein